MPEPTISPARPVPGPLTDLPPDLTLDGVLSRAAAAAPGRDAVRTATAAETRTVTFAELDAQASRVAGALSGLAGPAGAASGAMVALAPAPGLPYAAALHGIVRAGHVAVTVKPMLSADDLARVLRSTGARVAFLTEALAARADPAALDRVVVTDRDEPAAGWPAGWTTYAQVLAGADLPGPGGPRTDPESPALVHFTHGTTGTPKGVLLSHRNLVANAAQTAWAHELDRYDVVLNHLPILHCMHVNGPIWAGATQVLCLDPDVESAIRLANEHGARCFYAQPGQLVRLAADERLDRLRLTTVEVIRTGGTHLPAATARTLSEHFGVPVVQGYGLVETSSLTHSDLRAAPGPGTVGLPVPHTECVIADPDTGRPLPAGRRGEVRVRGPQVALGYLGRDDAPVDADGWLSTGDVGYLDGGRLVLVDRIGDLFKVGNELVSPTEVEQVLLAQPVVQECVVVGYPDEVLGQVPYALVVPEDRASDAQLAAAVAAANERLAPHQRIRRVSAIYSIPGAATGKVNRRALRERVIAGEPSRRDRGAPTMIVLMNKVTVTGDMAEFERAHDEIAAFMRAQPGARGFRLLGSLDEPNVFVELAEWDSQEAHAAAVRSPGFVERARALRAVAELDLGKYRVVRAERA
ncbi:AMP-binding protein [Actinomadura sp. ATCC 31491]|uniref:AMP-binding protein n=1 Tax=Actinomadura luzonensis TaxID=2805427 RepID=A0ABT0G929_9ACTN|nr:AMP-binding protein [Actinomadura luzonensis]MCK2221096.1 AMP-binding protein [Actinomadura luzonensis]